MTAAMHLPRLFPHVRAAVEQAAGDPHVWETDIEASREQARAESARELREDVAEVVDNDAGGVRCRLYRPAPAGAGVIVHLHGGGFVFHDIDVQDSSARRLANRSGLAVLSVEYRRPPEHPFPAARDDVDVVLSWLAHGGHAPDLSGPG